MKKYIVLGVLLAVLLAQTAEILPGWGVVQVRLTSYFTQNTTSKILRFFGNRLNDYLQAHTDIKKIQYEPRVVIAALYITKESNKMFSWKR